LHHLVEHVSLIPEVLSTPIPDGIKPSEPMLISESALKQKMEHYFTREMKMNGTAKVIPIDETLYIDLLEKERVKFIVDHQLFFHSLVSELPHEYITLSEEIEA